MHVVAMLLKPFASALDRANLVFSINIHELGDQLLRYTRYREDSLGSIIAGINVVDLNGKDFDAISDVISALRSFVYVSYVS